LLQDACKNYEKDKAEKEPIKVNINSPKRADY
jgi:hypothetical protein